jgi:hypothetical protein
MGKRLIIKGADFSANAIAISKELTLDDFAVREGYTLTTAGVVTQNNKFSGCDTPISQYVGREITITASSNGDSVGFFTNKEFANSEVDENIAVSDMFKANAGESITLTIPSNAQYLYLTKKYTSTDRFPSEIIIQ